MSGGIDPNKLNLFVNRDNSTHKVEAVSKRQLESEDVLDKEPERLNKSTKFNNIKTGFTSKEMALESDLEMIQSSPKLMSKKLDLLGNKHIIKDDNSKSKIDFIGQKNEYQSKTMLNQFSGSMISESFIDIHESHQLLIPSAFTKIHGDEFESKRAEFKESYYPLKERLKNINDEIANLQGILSNIISRVNEINNPKDSKEESKMDSDTFSKLKEPVIDTSELEKGLASVKKSLFLERQKLAKVRDPNGKGKESADPIRANILSLNKSEANITGQLKKAKETPVNPKLIELNSERVKVNDLISQLDEEARSIIPKLSSLESYDHIEDIPDAPCVKQNGYAIATPGIDSIPMLKTFGMGPCVGLTLWEQNTKKGFLAHIDGQIDKEPAAFLSKLRDEFLTDLPEDSKIVVSIVGGNDTVSSEKNKSSENIIKAILDVFPTDKYEHKVDPKNLLGAGGRSIILSLETGETSVISSSKQPAIGPKAKTEKNIVN